MISTLITQTKPEGASFHQPSLATLRHIRDTYVVPQKLSVEVTDDANGRTIKYNFATEEARAEYEADPVIIAMMEESRQHNATAGVGSTSTEVV